MKMRFLGLAITMILAITAAKVAHADTTQRIVEEKRVVSNVDQTVDFTVPEIAAGQQVRLGLDARIDWRDLAGSNPVLILSVNGQAVVLEDLLNKPLEYTMRDGSETTWAHGPKWRLMYSPDFSDEVKTRPFAYGVPDTDPYRFVMDITRYVKPGANKLTFRQPQFLTFDTTVVVRNVDIEVGAPIASKAGGEVLPAPTGPLPTYVAQGRKPVAMQVRLGSGGALQVQVGQRKLDFTSRTSEPNGQWREATAGKWNTIARGRNARAGWEGTGYHVQRVVSVKDDHVEIADTFTNTGADLVGVIYENRLSLPEKPSKILLAGRPAFSDTQIVENPAHPTTLAQWDDFAVGMAAVDDIYRVHIKSFTEPQATGLADDQLGLAPGQSHTLQWSIYPLPGGDYWDFVNAVRRDWGSNFTIPAAMSFDMAGSTDGSKSAEYYGQWVKQRGVQWALSSQTVYQPDEITTEEMVPPSQAATYEKRPPGTPLVAEATGIPYAKKWMERAFNWSTKMKQGAPGTKTLIYLHTQINTEPYHYKKYADDIAYDAAGKPISSVFSFPLTVYLPTLDNTYGKALMAALPKIMAQSNTDGFYNDEMDYATDEYDYSPKRWDNCSVIIDPKTHAVTGKRSSVVLMQQSWKVAMGKYLKANGKILMGNGSPMTRTMLDMHIPRFVETASYSFVINTHFSSPIGLANHDGESSDISRTRMARRFLDQGALFCGYHWSDDEPGSQFLHQMFPMTPEELHPGMMLGKERIITNRSGRYGWPDGAAATIYVYDEKGNVVANPDVKAVKDGKRNLTEIRMPSNYFAILVRK